MILDKVKTIGIWVLLTFTIVTSVSTWLLVKDNNRLRSELTIKQAELSVCLLNAQHAEKEKDIADKTLGDVFEEHERLVEDYSELKDKLQETKCKSSTRVEHIYLNKGVSTNEVSVNEKSPDTANSLNTVRVLLDTAACRANNNCSKPSESSPTPL